MKRYISMILTIFALAALLLASGCKESSSPKANMAELIIGDWYTLNGVPYRSFSADGTVTGSENYSSPYTVDGNIITWNTAAGNEVTVEFYTDGEMLRISSGYGGYFTTRRYYLRNPNEPVQGTVLPEKGTADEGIFGMWYNGDTLFFSLGSDCSVSDYRDLDSFCFDGESLVLFKSGAASDEAAKCSLSGDTLTIYYTDELTGSDTSLVLTRK